MTATHMASTSDTSRFDNATIGEDALIDPDVEVGYRYHADCGPATIGKHCALRKGTVIYGDVKIGDHFHTGHYAVIRAMAKNRRLLHAAQPLHHRGHRANGHRRPHYDQRVAAVPAPG